MAKKQIVLYLKPEEHKAFKLATVAADTSMNAVLADCVKEFVSKQAGSDKILTDARALYRADSSTSSDR